MEIIEADDGDGHENGYDYEEPCGSCTVPEAFALCSCARWLAGKKRKSPSVTRTNGLFLNKWLAATYSPTGKPGSTIGAGKLSF